MSSRSRLRSALRAIDDAATSLKRARTAADGPARAQIQSALSDLEDAEADIKRAIRELPDT